MVSVQSSATDHKMQNVICNFRNYLVNYNHLINNDETIKQIVNSKKGLIMHTYDLFKILAFIFFMTISIYVGFAGGNYFFILFSAILLFIFSRAVVIRYKNTLSTYVITSKRILFIQNDKIIKSKFIESLQTASYENCGNNRGYIILGKSEELFAGRGVNFTEDEFVLDNLTNYNETAELLKEMIKKNCI